MKGQIYFQSGRYYIQIYWDGKTHKIWKYLDEPMWHRKTADKYLSKIRAEIDDGTFVLASHLPEYPLSVDQYAQRWIKVHKVRNATRRGYECVINKHIIPYWKNRDMRKIRHLDLVEFSDHLPEKMRTNVMSCFKTMMRFAWRNEDLPKLPPFPPIKTYDSGPIKYLTREQQEKVFDAIPSKHQPIFRFMAEYGLRVAEARSLMWDCVKDDVVTIRRNFSYDELVETTKTGKIRSFKLTTRAKNILGNLQQTSTTFIFTTRGRPYKHTHLWKIWNRACSSVGINIPIKNGTRHSLASRALNDGMALDQVQKMLGHTKIETTQRYAVREQHHIDDYLENRDSSVVEFPERKSV